MTDNNRHKIDSIDDSIECRASSRREPRILCLKDMTALTAAFVTPSDYDLLDVVKSLACMTKGNRVAEQLISPQFDDEIVISSIRGRIPADNETNISWYFWRVYGRLKIIRRVWLNTPETPVRSLDTTMVYMLDEKDGWVEQTCNTDDCGDGGFWCNVPQTMQAVSRSLTIYLLREIAKLNFPPNGNDPCAKVPGP